mgnify:CR=1 FL=1
MMVLITYDVNTTKQPGRRRLNKIAKICCNYGQRVQNSVFECSLTPAQFVTVKSEILNIADKNEDSIRIYHLGNNYNRKIEQYGCKTAYDPEGELIL